MAYNTFDIISGGHAGRQVFFNERSNILEIQTKKTNHPVLTFKVRDISSLELIESKIVKKTDSITFGIVGALLGGPIGAAAGASLGGLSRPCTFAIETTSGTYVCEGLKLHYNKLYKAYKIQQY